MGADNEKNAFILIPSNVSVWQNGEEEKSHFYCEKGWLLQSSFTRTDDLLHANTSRVDESTGGFLCACTSQNAHKLNTAGVDIFGHVFGPALPIFSSQLHFAASKLNVNVQKILQDLI